MMSRESEIGKNKGPLDERNPSGTAMTDPARYWLEKTRALDGSHRDAPDPYWLNRITWYSISKGTRYGEGVRQRPLWPGSRGADTINRARLCLIMAGNRELTMATVSYAHIEPNASGEPIIAGTRIKVRMIALARIAHGWDAEEIQRHHPDLSLGQVHSALAYYYDHKEEMDRESGTGMSAPRDSGPEPARLRAGASCGSGACSD